MKEQNIQKVLISLFIIIFLAVGVIAWTASTVTLQSPSSGVWKTSGTNVGFNFSYTSTGTDYDLFCNATLFLNGAVNITYGNGTGIFRNGTTGNISGGLIGHPKILVPSMYDGTYIWNVRIENLSNQKFWWAADNYTLYIDSVIPVVSIQSPTDAGYATTDALTVRGVANDTNPDTCNLYVGITGPSAVVNETVAFTNATNFTFSTVSGFAEGQTAFYTVACIDDADNIGWATNRTRHFDLTNPTIEVNFTNATYHASTGVSINYTVRTTGFLDTCVLYGNFNRSTGVASTMARNQTMNNATQTGEGMLKDQELNFSSINLVDTNQTGVYRLNIWCNTSGNRSAWAFTTNRTLYIDTVPPSAPEIVYMSPQLYTNTTGTVIHWGNHSATDVVTDATPYIVFKQISDVNDVTVTISFDNNDTDLATAEYITAISGTANPDGSMTLNNYSAIGLSPGRPYTTYYYAINVTDAAGHVNWSGNQSTLKYVQTYRVSAYGANLTEDIWNPISVARTINELNLSSIVKETGADYVAVYNITHSFETCSNTSHATHACRINVSQGDPVWIYRSTNGSWDYSYWTIGSLLNPMMDSVGLGWGATGGLLNLTNITTGWNYISVLNWSIGCNYQEIQDIMNGTNPLGPYTYSGLNNLNSTGEGGDGSVGLNITFMSFLNVSDSTYYPYFWDFRNPWNATRLHFRDVYSVWLNYSSDLSGSHSATLFNRSAC